MKNKAYIIIYSLLLLFHHILAHGSSVVVVVGFCVFHTAFVGAGVSSLNHHLNSPIIRRLFFLDRSLLLPHQFVLPLPFPFPLPLVIVLTVGDGVDMSALPFHMFVDNLELSLVQHHL